MSQEDDPGNGLSRTGRAGRTGRLLVPLRGPCVPQWSPVGSCLEMMGSYEERVWGPGEGASPAGRAALRPPDTAAAAAAGADPPWPWRGTTPKYTHLPETGKSGANRKEGLVFPQLMSLCSEVYREIQCHIPTQRQTL